MDHAAFITQAWKTLARALAEAGVQAELDLRPAVLSKQVRRRCMAELKRLTLLIRRLIFLMALAAELAPLTQRDGRNYFETDKVPASTGYRLSLVPAPGGPCPDFLRGPDPVPWSGPVDAAPVIARWRALLHTLKHCGRRAKCLARTLQRWQAAGEPRPYVLPMARAHRLSPQLGLIAGALRVRLNEGLKHWPDTG